MLKWLKSAGLETPDLGHLKRIRKQQPSLETTTPTTTLLLVTTLTAPSPPTPPPELGLPPPYVVRVPSTPALTPPVLKLKCTLWPTLFTPPRKGEAEPWTRGRARWAWEAMQAAVEAAKQANKTGELPIAAYIAAPYDDDEGGTKQKELTFVAHDTRVSSAHPLRHAVINVVRQMADYRARSSSLASTPTPSDATEDEVGRNGTNYLLTSLTVFTTHEPCIMCSMALIHSRVKEVVFLHPMPRTGGCGGAACLPTLKGINHRFGIGEWKRGHCEGLGLMPKQEELYVDETIDA
ncbi:hypothetical protein H0H81_001021 [Sphagnurus paluster]|uniref:CMP/dCMP-type deaminase domain-containing protein n=1 Tax=Sphagnurus paluster TaxID=117069 RepID=A0A9P7FTE5_9AGAR|nr:hypothetical protein H0H81_001021 [Sphagnurus paluster]